MIIIIYSQWAAMRPDLFHDSICLELSKLQAGAKVHSWEQTQQILRSALGENWQKHISLNEKDLLGSGCAAQVYRGTLMLSASPEEVRQEGKGGKLSASDSPRNTQEVAIKILHPNIRQLMQLDLNLMHSVAYSLECVGGFLLGFYTTNSSPALESAELSALQLYPLRCVSLSESVQEFATFMQSQLDLTQEARALDRLRYDIF